MTFTTNKIPFLGLASVIFIPTSLPAQTIGDTNKPQVTIIKPQKEQKEVKSSKIDTEKFELGVYTGILSLEDFDAVSVTGISAGYHINPKWMASVSVAKSAAPKASFEQTVGGNFIKDRDSGFQYMAIMASYELAEGRSFRGKMTKLSSHIYLDVGLENVSFLGEDNIGAVLGLNYKLVATDWLTGNLTFRNHIVERTFLDENKTTQNVEAAFGLNILF